LVTSSNSDSIVLGGIDMDINDLKKTSAVMKEEKESLESMKEATLERFEEFKKTCNTLSKLIAEKVAPKKMELGAEFREFFESNGFSVEAEEKGKYKATFENTVVILEDDNPDEYSSDSAFTFQIPTQKKYTGVVIKAEKEKEDKLYWKNILKHNGRNVGFENVRELIFSIEDTKELKVLLDKINENIEWYQDTIEVFEDIKFVYSVYRTGHEFETFKEVFEAL
jgi:hypothetical protein